MDYMPFFSPDIGNITTIVRWVNNCIPANVLTSFEKKEITEEIGLSGYPCKQIIYMYQRPLNYTNGDWLYSITLKSAEIISPGTLIVAGTFKDHGLINHVRKVGTTMVPTETSFKNEQELKEELKKIFNDMSSISLNSPLHLWTRIAELTHIAEGLVKDKH